ncbi:hypothetical protein ACP70R_026145 [Stipagrostis hirtigluma subsp. patula]
MGKAGEAEQGIPRPVPATGSGGFSRCCGSAVGEVLNAKCVCVLLLAVGGFLSAFFLLFHFRASGAIPDDPGTLGAEIQAGFILLMPQSELAPHAGMLEQEIYSKIGVPNSKVSVSMHPYKDTNYTYVRFGILPDPRNTSISPGSMSTLRASLIRLTLQQLNLSLTPCVFGDPFCLDILGFPGGITVSLPHRDLHEDSILPIFNITLDLTIRQVREYLEKMKIELGYTLEQTPAEELFAELTNTNGSTVATPVTIQVSISTNDHSIYVQPYRLKQLAKIIIQWNSRNLGLDPSIFGRIRDLKLSPLLQDYIMPYAPSSPPAPTPSLPSHPISEAGHPKTNPYWHLSCPALVEKQNATIAHRKLISVPSMVISPQLPTGFHRRSTSRGKKNSVAVAVRTLNEPAP